VSVGRASASPRSVEWLAAASSEQETDPGLDTPRPPYTDSPLVPPGPAGELQRRLAAGGLVKIAIARPGWYELDQQALQAAGVAGAVDPVRLSLWQEGRPVALSLLGLEDGRFDAGDRIGFYAEGQNSPYTGTRVSWLGTGDGAAARLTRAVDQAGPPVTSYPASLEQRPRAIYFSALKNGDEENFFGPTVTGVPVSRKFPLDHVASSTGHAFSLEVAVQGVSDGDHQIAVTANGVEVGTLTLADRARKSSVLPLPPSLLVNGDLAVTLTAVPGGTDVSLIDFLRLSYPRRLVATSGRLWAVLPGGATAQVEGFAPGQRVTAVDITDPHTPAWVFEVLADPAGTVTIPVAGSGARDVLVTAESGRPPPALVVKDTPSRLAETAGGDLVVVGPSSLLPAIAPLAERRRAEGWRVLTVALDDVFDEFSFGIKHPGAIRAFMRQALASWSLRPRALLLLGDASFDPRNLLGKGDFDLLPTKLVETRYMETAFDDWFTDFDDDGIADIAVGRLPARNSADLAALVDKLLAVPRARIGEQAGTLAVLAGRDDDIHAFSRVASELTVLGAGRAAVATAQQTDDAVASQQALAAALARDPELIAFAGHGSETQWAGGWLGNDRVADLPAGSGRGGFWVMLTCLNGFFHDIHQTSLAETLLFRRGGGAFGVWASSGVTGLPEQATIGRRMLAALLEGGITVGEAAAQAKRSTEDLDVRRTWLLLGDPSWTWRAAEVGPIDAGADAPDAPSDTGVPLDGAPVPVQDAGDAAATRSPDAAASGCGCRSVPAASGGGWGVLLVLGLLLGRHYRRCFVGRR
jgi:MYXO-CTERM domain-containing protein